MTYNKKENLVECDNCYKQYDETISPKQATGCACELVNQNNTKFIYGLYGSKYDTYKYKVSIDSKISHQKEESLLCDECMEKLILKKELIKEEEFNYWDNTWQQNIGLENID